MTRPRAPHASRRYPAGAVTVELAVTISVLFIVLFAAWDFSRAMMIIHTIDNAAYEGSRRGIVPGATADDIRGAVNVILDAVYVNNATVTINPPTMPPTTTEVTVTISAPMNQNAWLAPVFLKDRTFTCSYKLTREKYATVSVP